MSHDWDDEPVGYKKPPRWTQFRKGQSGNPKGRPAKKKRADAVELTSDDVLDRLLREELDRKIMVNDASGRRELPMQHVVIRAQATAAAKGNVHAQRDVLRQARELAVREAARAQIAQAENRQVFEYVVKRRREQAEIWKVASETGTEPDRPWPHPDDIFIDHANQKWRVHGPWDETDLPRYEYLAAMRDVHMLRWAIGAQEKSPRGGFYLVIAMIYDLQLPKRWQCLREEPAGDRAVLSLIAATVPRLRARLKAAEREAARLEPSAGLPPFDKDSYRVVNKLMKPLLKQLGYRSLAHLERVHEMQIETSCASEP